MLSVIKDNFDKYLEIYNGFCLDESKDPVAINLLKNSLYLSVFTTFEDFLKKLIKDYLNNISDEGIKFTDLSSGFAKAFFMGHQKQINKILENKERNEDAFKSYFKKIKENIKKEELEKYIFFKFLHESNLKGYYKDLFEQILGDRDFLSNLELNNIDEYADIEIINSTNANNFLIHYVEEIRNSIAHQNQEFKVGELPFKIVIAHFLFIIEKMIKKYEEHTNFEFGRISINLLA